MEKYNYPSETHHITTKDDYILTIHRIPHGPNSPKPIDRPAILLLHGLACSSNVWVTQGPGKDFGKPDPKITSLR